MSYTNHMPIPGDMFPRELAELGRVINDRLQHLSDAIGGSGAAAVAVTSFGAPGYSGTHDQRLVLPAASVPEGSTFYEQDRTVLYRATTTEGQRRAWLYESGEMVNASSTLAGKPSDLGADDAGFRLYNSTYNRVWAWSGSAWSRASGEAITLEVSDSASAIGATGWHALDGSAGVRYTKDDATTDTLDLPSGSGTMLEQGTWSGSVDAAVGPGVSGTTDPDGDHNHFVNVTGTTGAPSAGTVVQSGTGASVASAAHTHNVSASGTSNTDGLHSHNISITADDTARPPRIQVYRAIRL